MAECVPASLKKDFEGCPEIDQFFEAPDVTAESGVTDSPSERTTVIGRWASKRASNIVQAVERAGELFPQSEPTTGWMPFSGHADRARSKTARHD